MNVTYWLVVSILLILAFIIILPPLWKKRQIVGAASDQRNIKIAKERANDLKQQLATGALSQEQFDEQYSELQLNLGDDLDIPHHLEGHSDSGRWVIPVIVVLVPLFSIFSYLLLGEPDALIKAEIKQPQQADTPQVDVNAMVSGLAERMKNDPTNAKGWVMLGRSYKYLKQYALAVESFDKAYQLLGDDPELMLQYADTLALNNGGSLAGKSSDLIFKALEITPNDPTGLWLAGMAKAEKREFTEALQYWKKLEAFIPPGSQYYKELQVLISAAKKQLTGNGTSSQIKEAAQKPQSVEMISITVQVKLTDAIKAEVADTDTVFIYAKALSGPPMPLAIVRKRVLDLPITVNLDDSMAMMPSMKLSNFKQVQVVARVSKSGTAMQQPGDFLGKVKIEKLTGNSVVDIEIDQKI